MRTLSFIIFFIIFASLCNGQSPHGKTFNRDCKDCHVSDSWKVNLSKISFKHEETGFALTGQHKIVTCRACHSSLEFSTANNKTQCFSCHEDIHENTVGKNCVRCHDPRTWIIEKNTDLHRMSRFPLIGNHTKANCNQCHLSSSKLRFDPIGINCFDCHSVNYYATKSPNHVNANFSTDCQKCHNLISPVWATTAVTHDFFPLTGSHNISNCFACHNQTSYKGLSQDCYSCHKQKYESVGTPNHVTLNFPKDCKTCHTTTGGWKPAIFTNHDSYYPLVGAHNLIRNNCTQCHATGYSSPARQCVSCHQQNYNSTVNPNHQGAGFSTDCVTCHTPTAWKPSTFDHDAALFPINSGSHKGQWNFCSDCHVDQSNFKNFECINCHTHAKTETDSKHVGVNGYSYQSRSCFACHPRGSKDGVMDHSLTNFPLVGAHVNVSCIQCHQTGYAGTPTACISCHQAKFTSAPNHVSQNYPQDCKQCHTPVDWKQISFNHSTTRFPLVGSHVNVNCSSCHTTKLVGTSQDCYSCHQAKYNSAPNHVAQGFPTDCAKCHSAVAWNTVTFNHSATAFPLTGSHVNVSCGLCHTNGYSGGTPTTCISCHQTKFNSAPNHLSQGFPTDCTKCHSTVAWNVVTFNHSTTIFPLTGSHVNVSCGLCHTTGYSGGTPTTCISCHQVKFNSAPNHVAQGFPTDCTKCHSTVAWNAVTFNHSTTIFPLTGSHVNVSCGLCHTTGYSGGTPTTCISCHQSKYNTAPNHVSQGYPTDCAQCHSTTAWQGATFNHSATAFPLTGSHVNVTCTSCHTTTFKGTSTVCSSCHLAKYQSTTNPNHVTLNIPTTCDQCHTTNPGWKPATFPIHNNYYPILGAHLTIANQCASCHTGGNYSNAPTQCVGCHQAKYNSATNPNHVTARFPTNCESCHTQNAWQPSTFNHDGQYFPIYSGEHRGKWSLCSDCHTDQTNFKVFSCFKCHPQAQMDSKHQGIRNYVSTPAACYSCHPTGSGG